MEEDIVVDGHLIKISTIGICKTYPPHILRERVRQEILHLQRVDRKTLQNTKGHLVVAFLEWLIARGEAILQEEFPIDEHKAYTVLKYGQVITDEIK